MLAMPPPELNPPRRALLHNGRMRELYKRAAITQEFKDRISDRF
jgi:hypothetical protein